ncbi:MAG: hypothetical protein KME09_07155 [Pleurocapsa minor HA4230-MV1]|jgi:hypothetical protein|nr:hypothetical protein [Pleurocapsa minor HA4230-MV1]
MTNTSATTTNVRVIDLSECLADITANTIYNSEHNLLPSDIFEDVILQAINDLIDDFALDPHNYLKTHHQEQIDTIAHDYLDRDLDKSELNFYFGEHI